MIGGVARGVSLVLTVCHSSSVYFLGLSMLFIAKASASFSVPVSCPSSRGSSIVSAWHRENLGFPSLALRCSRGCREVGGVALRRDPSPPFDSELDTLERPGPRRGFWKVGE